MAGDLSQGGTASKLAVRGELFIEGFSLPCFYTPWYKLPGGIHIHSATLRTPSWNDSRTTELRHPNVSVKYNGGKIDSGSGRNLLQGCGLTAPWLLHCKR